jgi:conjugative transfer signal peptidase TraF
VTPCNADRPLHSIATRRRFKLRPGLWLGILAIGILSLLADAYLVYPRTESAPRGLYLLTHQPLRRGSWVVACLPRPVAELGRRRGYLGPGRCAGTAEVLKQAAALPGDRVDLSAGGIRVNGESLPGTALLSHDRAGRAIPAIPTGRYTVPPGHAWLLSTRHTHSWDSRYYGAVPLHRIRSTARRLWPPSRVTP